MAEQEVVLDINRIQEILPHRYPFLMVDKVIEMVPNESIVAVKNVSINEPYFQGHFPGKPVMPGVMILEAMAQAAAILAKESPDGIPPKKLVYFAGADDVRWKRVVLPGDTIHIKVEFVKVKRPIWKVKGTVTVDGQLAASGIITAAEGEEM